MCDVPEQKQRSAKGLEFYGGPLDGELCAADESPIVLPSGIYFRAFVANARGESMGEMLQWRRSPFLY